MSIEEIKKEALELAIAHELGVNVVNQLLDRAYQEGQKEKLFVLYTDEMKKNREEATLAERKRCADIARNYKDDFGGNVEEGYGIAEAIEKEETV